MPSLPFSIYVEIALFCGVATRLSLLRLTKSLNVILRHLLYRNITVRGTSARKLVHTLANNPLLPLITWVLPELVNLWCLGIAPNIPLPQQVVPLITFHLTCFQAICSVAGVWCEFIASQSTLDELYLDSDFWGDVPSPQQLPHLRSFKGRPQDLVNFAEVHPLAHMWVFTGIPLDTHVFTPSDLLKLAASPSRLSTVRISALDFLTVLEAAPVLLTSLHLVVDEDLSWSNFTVESGDNLSRSTFGRLATALDGRFSHLRTVLLLTLSASRQSSPHIAAPGDCVAFCFYASDGYAFWYKWGQVLPRPPAPLTGPVERRREKLRPEPCAQGSSKTTNRSQTSVTDAQWNKWVDELVAAADEKAVNHQVGDEDETQNEKGEQEEEERERAWDTAVMLCVEGMREPDHRE
ncbi:hypothetical protein B0H14DRAFT_2615600 [Mycena olivaceomarginata]|nr:hypothetical protein B0H14DRAFT_2615600 [Mycena olivaceomarginata]